MDNYVLEVVLAISGLLWMFGVPFFKVVSLFTAVVLVLRVQGVL